MRAAALGWVMKVVVWPSLVGISICWSIMGRVVSLVGLMVSGPAFGRIARKPGYDKKSLPVRGTMAVLHSVVRIAIVLLCRASAADRRFPR
jgi:lipoprotein signal peptidase